MRVGALPVLLLLWTGSEAWSWGPADEGEPREAAFEEANRFYRQKNYTEAIRLYEGILAGGARSAAVEYNLGNAEFRMGDLGQAILHYERARRLEPRNRDVQQNLKIARKQLEDQPKAESRNAVVVFFDRICASYTADEWAGMASVVFFLLGGVVAARTFLQGVDARRRMRHVAIMLGVVFLWFGVNTAVQVGRLGRPEAIILSPEVLVYAEPNPPGGQNHLFKLHEGSQVLVARREGGWALVEYTPGLRGWCPEDALGLI